MECKFYCCEGGISIKVTCLPKKKLDFDEVEERFWTSSKVFLGYIINDVRRFITFECNKLKALIHQVNGAIFQLKKILQMVPLRN